jgi:hypothetical protein
MKRTIVGLTLGAILAGLLPAWAHTDEYFEVVEALHGGQLRMAGPYHLALVAKDREITLYMTDHADNKITTDGGLGKATIETGRTRTQIGMHTGPYFEVKRRRIRYADHQAIGLKRYRAGICSSGEKHPSLSTQATQATLASNPSTTSSTHRERPRIT